MQHSPTPETTAPDEKAVKAGARKVSVVVPTYGSAAFIDKLVASLLAVFAGRTEECEIILVDDCSPDTVTWPALTRLHEQYPAQVKIVRLLKNAGQHNAILCGLGFATGDVIVTMDDDLQHPPEELPKLLRKLDEGYDLVIGAYDEKRHAGYRNRGGELVDAIIRRIYRLPATTKLTSFRAMTKSLVEVARKSQNPYPYVTCILLDQASRVANVEVRHAEREHGSSSYSLMRSVVLATNLLFSYSSLPLYLTAGFCLLASVLALMMMTWVFITIFLHGVSVPGWASAVTALTLFSTFMLASMFVMGVYIARIHHQLSGRRVPFTVDRYHE
ncbi:dolichol-phosphate mannosyltransferase/undecaprenyl-phosphate 4-deoxy-4-formamido-L-arabinose transferase [Pseudaminobacter salicylatoxidans]|uniref:Dolichol-phosphate mannosyltransferase/undecaprenyl-phosphate 4-deoxy-4-formamido-L-arabinose transferase n=1 Tax=Pseudaminobacter salicylatoxidans TaxID=93369 RepID=A0A316C648_PSESE|nr:glycosyltransferase family 2 protein [Pseudaminobacter salicylatoxidans]PWJ85018.1 dolichol-phosphate mannosyltransferase/undecaprenyl-phosphate 4-deoxy-4-formamido-L-arabinose transferase [Pseudaminobacter salicylatoxidans]